MDLHFHAFHQISWPNIQAEILAISNRIAESASKLYIQEY